MSPWVRTREWAGADYYADLGVGPDAPSGAIDDAFRALAKELHPDRNPDVGAAERFKHVATGYRVLRDPVTRAAYDEYRARITAGTLYERAARTGGGSRVSGPSYGAMAPPPPRPRRVREPMPDWARTAIAWVLVVSGLLAALWALLGAEGNTAGDTPVAVQVTLAIMATKLIGSGLVVHCYPRLRARWDQ